MRIAITGGTGFVGRSVAGRLRAGLILNRGGRASDLQAWLGSGSSPIRSTHSRIVPVRIMGIVRSLPARLRSR